VVAREQQVESGVLHLARHAAIEARILGHPQRPRSKTDPNPTGHRPKIASYHQHS
jgi:hypothetical protein